MRKALILLSRLHKQLATWYKLASVRITYVCVFIFIGYFFRLCVTQCFLCCWVLLLSSLVHLALCKVEPQCWTFSNAIVVSQSGYLMNYWIIPTNRKSISILFWDRVQPLILGRDTFLHTQCFYYSAHSVYWSMDQALPLRDSACISAGKGVSHMVSVTYPYMWTIHSAPSK